MADWEEIKRLAADFQKVQLSSTAQRLSERNCIEIVTYLIQRKMIDLIFTSDGKEYMTPTQLVSNIRTELYMNGGRVNLSELSKVIGVDYSHITAHINDVLKGHKDIHYVLGQLIDFTYISKVSNEINEKLQQQGQINISDLTMQYDLPAEFLQTHVLERNLEKLIFGRQDKSDPRVFFTESFVARTKSKIRGALTGLTRPTPIHAIFSNLDIPERLLFSLFGQTCHYGVLTSKIAGAQYIPNVYSRSQNMYVSNFFKQNHYIEFETLTKLGITDQKSYLKKFLANENVKYLNSCVISKSLLDRVEADIEECINSKSYLDIYNNLPSVFNENDIQSLLDVVLKQQNLREIIVINNVILTKAFVDALSDDCEKVVGVNARLVVESGAYQQYVTDLQVTSSRGQKCDDFVASKDDDTKADKREERRKKAAGGKSGGGTQGRETKTKSTKKHARGKNVTTDDSEDIPEKRKFLEIVSRDDINGLIQGKLEEEGLDELIQSLTEYLYPILNKKGVEFATDIYKTTVADRTANKRETHNELQNKLNALIGDVRLFEKGIKLFPADIQVHLNKYLLKTLCTDIVMELLKYIAMEENLCPLPDNSTNDQKNKFINELSQEYKQPMIPLAKTLSGQNVEEFLNIVEDSLIPCSMILKKIDKKKDRVIVLNHKHNLLDQLSAADDPALILHLSSLVLFISATQNMVHASGRHVAAILIFLKQYLSQEESDHLTSYHDLVTVVLNSGSESETVKEQLVEKMTTIKNIANEFKRPGASEKN